MPFKSEAQRRFFHANEDISPKTVEHWEHATPKKKKLPKYVEGKEAALVQFGLRKEAGSGSMIGKGLSTGGKMLSAVPTGIGNLAGAAIGGIGGAIQGVASAPPGQGLRHGLIGAASGAASSALPGMVGMAAEPLINAGMHKVIPGGG